MCINSLFTFSGCSLAARWLVSSEQNLEGIRKGEGTPKFEALLVLQRVGTEENLNGCV
jgi:hypothetical protein